MTGCGIWLEAALKINQRFAFYLNMQDGKVGAHLLDIKDRRDVG